MANLGPNGNARIEVRIDASAQQFAVLLDGELVKQSNHFADVRVARIDIEFDIYEKEGEWPYIWEPHGHFTDSGKWIPTNSGWGRVRPRLGLKRS